MKRPPLTPIDADARLIERCEQRLALSASLAGELLLEALEPQHEDLPLGEVVVLPQSIPTDAAESSAPPLTPNLIEQAAELRDTFGLDGRGQTVAVIDSGVAWDHVSLGGGFGPGYRVVGGWDFAENDANPYDDGPAGYHGTHVSGLLAGESDGFVGIAPAADIVALRVFDDAGVGELQWIESALQFVHENQDAFASPITTVNLSVGAALTDANRLEAAAMLEDELQLLRDDNILVFAASGNFFDASNAEGVLYPASSPSVVAVGSVDERGELSEFSQRNEGLLSTRGESVRSAVPDHVFGWDGNVDDFAPLDGTSMATPQVAAASMLIRQSMLDQGIDPTADAVLARLREAAIEQVDAETALAFHTINLQSAVDSAPSPLATASIDRFDGSNESESVEIDLRDGAHLRVGDRMFQLDEQRSDEPLVIDAGGGHDSLLILGSEGTERLILRPPSEQTQQSGDSILTIGDRRIELRGFERVEFRGGGGSDRASLFDSPGSDTLTSHPGRATLRGVGFQFDTFDVPRVYVHGTAGGSDTAFLHDSEGDDTLAVRPRFTSLQSDDSFQLAYGFEKVYAYATAGGNDDARLYDSDGDDTMSISSERSIITGPGYHVSARGFESTEGHAIAGGNDVARIYADESSSLWHSTDNMVQWTGRDNDVRVARGFERTQAFEQFEPIELSTQDHGGPILFRAHDDDEDADNRAARESEASRLVFQALGNA